MARALGLLLAIGAVGALRPVVPAAARARSLLRRRETARVALGGALGVLVARPGGAEAACDPTALVECEGNFWESGRLFYRKAEQVTSYKSDSPKQSDRTLSRLVARLQVQRNAFANIAPLVALGSTDDARRRLRAPPLDDVRKASSDIALFQPDTGAALRAQRAFTDAIDRLDTQLMLTARKDRSVDGLDTEFALAAGAFDAFLDGMGMPKPERPALPSAEKDEAPVPLR